MIGTVISPGASSLSAKAYDLPTGTTHISADTIHSWLGDTIPAQYVGTDGQYHSTSATWRTSETILSNDMGYAANVYNGRTMGFYIITIPAADVGTWSPLAPIALVTANLHFSNVTYADFGFGYYINNKYRNVSYASCQPYCYLDYNYAGSYNKLYNPESDGSINQSYLGHLGIFTARYTAQYGSVYGGGFQRVEGSASDLYIGDVAACCLGYFDGNLWLGLGLTDIIINDDYVLETSAPPPQGGGDTPSGSSSGKVTGTIGDQDVNVNVDITQDFPDWMYSADVTDYDDGGFDESVTSLGSVDVEGMASGVSSLGTYDSGILWYALEQLFGQHTEIVLLLSGCGALCLFGFVLNRFGR